MLTLWLLDLYDLGGTSLDSFTDDLAVLLMLHLGSTLSSAGLSQSQVHVLILHIGMSWLPSRQYGHLLS